MLENIFLMLRKVNLIFGFLFILLKNVYIIIIKLLMICINFFLLNYDDKSYRVKLGFE